MISCLSQKKAAQNKKFDPKAKAEKLRDSLIKNGVDTLLSYWNVCSGCLPGRLNSYYVYWIKEETAYLSKFTEEGYLKATNTLGLPISFISSHFNRIKKDSLIEPEIGLMHYSFEKVFVKLGDKNLNFQLDIFEKRSNQTNYKVLTVDKIRSALFDIQVFDVIERNNNK